MANLVKIAELLKNAPDQALMQQLNNPDGSAPSYMVLSELQRRKKLRGSLMSQEPQSSVAEDLENESANAGQMGLGSFDQQPQQPPMQQQAPVGMAQGGEVKHYFNGNEVYTSEPGYNPFAGFSMPDFTGKAGWSDEQDQLYKDLLTAGMSPEQAKARVFGTEAPIKPVAPAAAPAPAAPPAAPASRNRAAAPTGGLPTLGKSSTASDDYSVNPLLEEARGIRKQLADAYKNQADVYKQQAEDVRKTKDVDAAMALLTAGFGIAGGRSANALENIGQGALPGVQQYAGSERARREQLQKLALGQGALGIEQLGAQMRGVTAEGELGLGGEKMDIARRGAAADEMRARATAASVANQASQWKQDNAKDKVNQQRAATLINYLKTDGINLDEPTKAQYVSEINRLLGVGAAPQNKLTGNSKEGYKYGYN